MFTVTVLQAGAEFPDPYSVFSPTTHTVCEPSLTVTDAATMWCGWTPDAPPARTVVTAAPSTVTSALIGAVVSGSIAQPATVTFAPFWTADRIPAVGL